MRSSAGSTSRSGSWPRRNAGSTCGSAVAAVARTAADVAVVRRPRRRRAGGLLADSAWMPRVVLMAKSTYVWLDQLSRRYGRDIRTLDAIPDEELDTLARWGVTGLWLIGLWQRSEASERIKRMRGNPDAVASAYSLDDYRIADDLGGEGAYANLRDRAWARGIRLASDMVPNHMGIDSRWVIEHPEWFLSLPRAALSRRTPSRGRTCRRRAAVGIVLEDHYWDDSDAAVVFKRFDRETGDERYVYHGNDGTSFPVERHRPARLPVGGGPRAGHPDDPRRRPAVPDHPVRRRDGPRQASTSSGCGGREPGARRDSIPSRAEHAMRAGRVRPADAERVLARGRRPGRGRGAGHAPAGRGVLDARGLLRPDARHAPRLQQRVHAHAPRRGRGRLPEAHPRDARVRSGDPQALRQLHEQPGRGDRARAVRQGRQVLRRRDGPRDAARAADARPRPGRGLRREVRHGVPPRDDSTSSPTRGWSSATSARSSRCSIGGRGSPRRTTSCCTTSSPTAARVDENVLAYSNGHGPTRSLVLYPRPLRVDRGHDPRVGGVRAQVGERGASAWSAGRSPRAWACPNDPAMFVTFRDARTGLAVPALVPRDPRARAVAGARCRTRATCSGSSARSGRGAGPVAAPRRAARRAGRAVARRGAARAAAGARPRAAPGAVRGRPRRRRPRRNRRQTRTSTCSRRRFAAFLAAVATATGVDGDPVRWPRQVRDLAAEALPSHEPRRGRRPTRSPSGDRAALLVWLVLSRLGALAPGADVGGRRAWPGTTSCAWRRSSPPGSGRPASTKAAAWATADLVRVAARAAAPVQAPRPRAAARAARLLEALAGERRRSARRSGSTPGKAWSGSTATVRGAARAGPSASTRSRRAHRGRPSSRPGSRRPRRRPATGSSALPSSPLAGPDAADERASCSPNRRNSIGRIAEAGRCRTRDRVEEDPPEERRRRRAVSDDRLEVRPVAEARRLAEAAGQPARLGSRRRRPRPPPPRAGGPRARCPTSPSSPRSRSTAGSTTAARGRTWRGPRPPPGTRRRPSARRPRPRSSRRSGSGHR